MPVHKEFWVKMCNFARIFVIIVIWKRMIIGWSTLTLKLN
jgi:hypothetical protein